MLTTTPQHLALFARSLSGGGGAERAMTNLAGALADRGYRVDFVLARTKGRFLSEVPSSVRLVELNAPPALSALPSLLRVPDSLPSLFPIFSVPGVPRVLGAIPALSHYLRDEQPDALLSALDYANVAALVARRLAGVSTRTVISIRNRLTESAANANRLHLRWVPRLARRFYPDADAVVAVSNGVANDLARVTGLPVEHITTIYNPVVTPDIAARAGELITHPWFAPGETPVLLGIGKLKRQKDFHTLIRAFAKVRERRPTRLVILGEVNDAQKDAERRAELTALAAGLGVADDVALPGFVNNPFAYMARASVFVLSSAWEGLPNVLIQALACGCPVVSTDCPSGPAEILEGGAYGPLVPVGDDAALAEAIVSVLDKPPDPERLRMRAAAFSVDRAVDRYLEVLLGAQ